MTILKQETMKVSAKGQLVEMVLGNVPITMDYNAALDLARMLRVSGKRAKQYAGDHSRVLRTTARLTDANEDEAEWQAARDSTATFGS